MKRSRLARHSPMRRSFRPSPYARRERNPEYLAFVRTLSCRALDVIPNHVCWGKLEADHAGPKIGGRRAMDDTTCVALCERAHRNRHRYAGEFKGWSRSKMRAWLDEAIIATQGLAIAMGVWSGPRMERAA